MKKFWLGIVCVMLLTLLVAGCGNNIAGGATKGVTASGSLYATSVPIGASLYVDNQLKGLTPLTVLNLSAGSHSVKLTKTGYVDYVGSVYIYAGQTANLSVTLVPAVNPTGSLYVKSSPTSAKLYVDSQYKGTTPLTAQNLSVGSHAVKVTKTGYLDYTGSVKIYGGQTTNLTVTLKQIVIPTGSLNVQSTPTGAKLYVDSDYKGLTPLTVSNLSVGNHSVRVTKLGYVDYVGSAIISSGKTTRLSVTLKQNVTLLGNLYVQSVPTDASLYVDGQLKGITPRTVYNLSVGDHSVRIAKAGYVDFTGSVTIVSGQTAYLNVTLQENVTPVGNLLANSIPQGADLYVDGVLKGNTPMMVQNLVAGSHPVVMTKAGYIDYFGGVVIVSGQTTFINITLQQNATPTGSLFVQSVPTNATLYVDGQAKGTTPRTISNLSAGSHSVRVAKSGYLDYTGSVYINAGQTLNLSVTLQQNVTQKGNLYVESYPGNATIYVDNQPKGTTPMTVQNLDVGTHFVRLYKFNYSDYNTTVDIFAGETTILNVTLGP